MEHFKADGSIFRSVGVAGTGSSKRKMVVMSMAVFAFLITAVIVFVMTSAEGTGADAGPAIYPIVAIFILSFGFSIFVVGRTMGGGVLSVDTSTGEVSFRNASSMGFRSTKVSRSDIQELVLHSYSYNQGRNTSYRVRFHTSIGDFIPAIFSFTDLNTAREAAGELASLLSVSLRENL